MRFPPTVIFRDHNMIETDRLQLFPYAPEHLLAMIDGVARFEELSGLRAAEGLRDLMVSPDVSPDWLARLRTISAPDPWVLGFAIIERESGLVIGTAGFKGPPNGEGMVEIGYGIVPAREGRGYATEAAAAIVNFALTDGRVHLVRAHTMPTANASTKVLGKCGFGYVGEVMDPEDGLVWRWERARTEG
jgi:RimJ/RimL family protein N-acetyltransferase